MEMTGGETDGATPSERALLARIADALERLAPAPVPRADPGCGRDFQWDGTRLHMMASVALPLDRFAGVDGERAALVANLEALKNGAAAHDMLLWGARGMGKSALVRAAAAHTGVALVALAGDRLASLPALFATLAAARRPMLVFVDDLAFDGPGAEVRMLRSVLDGGVLARPEGVRLAVTSNHRHMVAGMGAEARHARDATDDRLALVDRFGLVLGFHPPDQATYLEMVRRHCVAEGLSFDPADALAFALARGGRSGRTAWHYRTELLVRRATAGL